MPKDLAVWALSLGCPKNRVDTERLLGSLGARIKAVNSPGRARLALINTCAFIEPACRESLRAIFDVAEKLRKLKRKPILAVAGCLPGRYGIEELAKEIPEVDIWLDSKSIAEWPQKINAALALGDGEAGRLLSTRSYAWLKISEGCQRRCAFCAIPAIRGPLESMTERLIIAEARQALDQGAKELVLVGQDTTAWGRDSIMRGAKDGAKDIAGLVQSLLKLDGLRWLRLMYLYPGAIPDKLLAMMAEGGPLLPYLDIPFQHCAPDILARMGRSFQGDSFRLVEKIRAQLPNAALRTTLMTGFPGETDKDFEQLLQFVKDSRFQNLGVFPFMPEDGTKAASLPGQIPDKIKEDRADEIMRVQAAISRELLAECVGKRMDVLVDESREEEWPGLHAGRVWFQAPEVDGATYISGEGATPGAFVNAEIADARVYDLSALA